MKTYIDSISELIKKNYRLTANKFVVYVVILLVFRNLNFLNDTDNLYGIYYTDIVLLLGRSIVLCCKMNG